MSAARRFHSQPGAVGAASPAIPSAHSHELGGSAERAFHNPFLDDFEEVIAGTKYKAGLALHASESKRRSEFCPTPDVLKTTPEVTRVA